MVRFPLLLLFLAPGGEKQRQPPGLTLSSWFTRLPVLPILLPREGKAAAGVSAARGVPSLDAELCSLVELLFTTPADFGSATAGAVLPTAMVSLAVGVASATSGRVFGGVDVVGTADSLEATAGAILLLLGVSAVLLTASWGGVAGTWLPLGEMALVDSGASPCVAEESALDAILHTHDSLYAH